MNQDVELLRLSTAGSVDDGKSTLIGRLLYDCHCIYEDQLAAVGKVSKRRGQRDVDLSLLLDGLSAEREQGITIDVAYRYFATMDRKFIIADTPGHEQYTRNMVTGASTSDVALILSDSRKGLLKQSKRHLFVASLIGISHILIVINKMDLVKYDREAFERIKKDFVNFAAKLEINDLQFIPASALNGDMIVSRGENLDWYQGPTILSYLENLPVTIDRNLIDFRFPVQCVIRPHQDFRGYAGKIQSGTIKKGERIMVLPSGVCATVESILYDGKEVEMAFTPQSVVITLNREVDVSRGDFIVRENNLPVVSNNLEAMLCWFDEKQNMKLNKRYLMKIGTKTVPCFIESMNYKMDVETLHRDVVANSLALNEIGRVHVHTSDSVIYDVYSENRNTGCFILIDELTNQTVSAGIVLDKGDKMRFVLGNGVLKAKKGACLWFTGLSGSGKTTIAEKLAEYFKNRGIDFERIDGDVMRENISSDLRFTKEDRDRNIDRASYVAGLLSKHGVFAICTFISPYADKRRDIKGKVHNFVEIYVNTSLEVCENRDVKGFYKRARAGEMENFTGISDPYEIPLDPDLEIKTLECSVDEAAQKVVEFLINNGYLANE